MWIQKTEDKGLWNEYVDDVTGESSIKLHTPKTVWRSCPNNGCIYELIGSREARCTKCGRVRSFVVGKETLVDGKFLPCK